MVIDGSLIRCPLLETILIFTSWPVNFAYLELLAILILVAVISSGALLALCKIINHFNAVAVNLKRPAEFAILLKLPASVVPHASTLQRLLGSSFQLGYRSGVHLTKREVETYFEGNIYISVKNKESKLWHVLALESSKLTTCVRYCNLSSRAFKRVVNSKMWSPFVPNNCNVIGWKCGEFS